MFDEDFGEKRPSPGTPSIFDDHRGKIQRTEVAPNKTELPVEKMMEKLMAQQMDMQQKFMSTMMQTMVAMMERSSAAQSMPAPAPSSSSNDGTQQAGSLSVDDAKTKALLEGARKKDMAELEVALLAEKKKFAKKVLAYVKVVESQKKRVAESKLMMDDDSRTVYPVHMRGYKACPTEVELDKTFSKCSGEDWSFEVKFKAGASRRDVMEQVHHQQVALHKFILQESGADKVEALRIASRMDTFKASVLNKSNEFYTSDLDTGLDLPAKVKPSKEWLDAKIKRMYQEVVDEAMKEKSALDSKAEEQAKKSKLAEAELFKTNPAIALTEFIDSRVAAATDDGMQAQDQSSDETAKQVVEALKASGERLQ